MTNVEDGNDFHQVAAFFRSFEQVTPVIDQIMNSWQFYALNFLRMKTIQTAYSVTDYNIERKKGLVSRFFNWCQKQEEYRMGWLAGTLTGHGCILTPLTILFVILAGNNLVFWPLIIGAMGMSLVVNLAALPTKITIPVFFLSVLVDLVIIANCIALGLSI